MIETVITIHEAKCLMEILENDIPSWEKSKIALLLLILSANPEMVQKNEKVVTDRWSERSSNRYSNDDDYNYYGVCF